MPYDPYNGAHQFIDEQLGFPHQTSGHRPKQQLPRRDIAAAGRQAVIEAKARQRNFQGDIGMTPDAFPKVRPRPAVEDEELSTRPPRSAIRYQPEAIYRQGNTQVNKYTSPPPNQKHAIPPRRSAQYRQPEAQGEQYEKYINDIEEEIERPRYRRRTPPWYLLLVIGAVIALILWISGAWVNNWWTDTQNDWTYTQAVRTFSLDEAVGHNHDSTSHPSHFIVQNDKRHIIIIELPADDWTKAIIYSAPTLIGNGRRKHPRPSAFRQTYKRDGLTWYCMCKIKPTFSPTTAQNLSCHRDSRGSGPPRT